MGGEGVRDLAQRESGSGHRLAEGTALFREFTLDPFSSGAGLIDLGTILLGSAQLESLHDQMGQRLTGFRQLSTK